MIIFSGALVSYLIFIAGAIIHKVIIRPAGSIAIGKIKPGFYVKEKPLHNKRCGMCGGKIRTKLLGIIQKLPLGIQV
jgi:hypothetical protein